MRSSARVRRRRMALVTMPWARLTSARKTRKAARSAGGGRAARAGRARAVGRVRSAARPSGASRRRSPHARSIPRRQRMTTWGKEPSLSRASASARIEHAVGQSRRVVLVRSREEGGADDPRLDTRIRAAHDDAVPDRSPERRERLLAERDLGGPDGARPRRIVGRMVPRILTIPVAAAGPTRHRHCGRAQVGDRGDLWNVLERARAGSAGVVVPGSARDRPRRWCRSRRRTGGARSALGPDSHRRRARRRSRSLRMPWPR